MQKFLRRSMVFMLVIALVGVPLGMVTSAEARDDEEYAPDAAGMMLIDLVVYRPLGLVSTVLGTATFLLSWPWTAAHGNSEQGYQKLVANPARYTFKRHMGDL